MSSTVIVGVNWGDEGKGRIVDYLAGDADFVVRYQGGSNAGHTVVNDRGVFKLNLVPSGVLNPQVTNVLGPGMVIDIEHLNKELAGLESRGVGPINMKISDRATICFPFHADEDGWEEERLAASTGKPYGSTRRGIAPAYGDRALKKAIQIGELLHPEHLPARIKALVEWKALVAKGVYGKTPTATVDSVMSWLETHGKRVLPMICDTTALLGTAVKEGRHILFEAQLGALRDVCFGIYPFTSSSCCLGAFAPIGSGLFGVNADRIIGVVKAFSTCVGDGPFTTEMDEKEAKELREQANEFGAATGRPRRVGHFDAVASRYGAEVQGAHEIAITKLDCLSGRPTLLVCTHYEYKGKKRTDFPINTVLEHCRPIYREVPGWTEDITGVRKFEDLPKAARDYVELIETSIGRPARFVSVGAHRTAMIVRDGALRAA